MTTDFPGFFSPDASTEAPLEMLAACHHRLLRQCTTLSRLAQHVALHGADESAQEAAQRVIRYFDTSAMQHHADEEDDLFPALLESMAGSDAVCIRELTQALAREHRTLESQWAALRPSLEHIAGGKSVELDAARIEEFVNGYRAHIEREEDELLPMANRLLLAPDIQRIGRAMRLRRGIPDV